jgi:hypothetical protein
MACVCGGGGSSCCRPTHAHTHTHTHGCRLSLSPHNCRLSSNCQIGLSFICSLLLQQLLIIMAMPLLLMFMTMMVMMVVVTNDDCDDDSQSIRYLRVRQVQLLLNHSTIGLAASWGVSVLGACGVEGERLPMRRLWEVRSTSSRSRASVGRSLGGRVTRWCRWCARRVPPSEQYLLSTSSL